MSRPLSHFCQFFEQVSSSSNQLSPVCYLYLQTITLIHTAIINFFYKQERYQFIQCLICFVFFSSGDRVKFVIHILYLNNYFLIKLYSLDLCIPDVKFQAPCLLHVNPLLHILSNLATILHVNYNMFFLFILLTKPTTSIKVNKGSSTRQFLRPILEGPA